MKIERAIRWTLLVFSACLCVVATACYTFRFDFCAVITAFPAWVWFIPGLLAAILGDLPGRVRWLCVAMAMIWVGYVLVFADEPTSITRGILHSITATNVPSFRVVSINCNLGNPRAALDTAACKPDIILLQETPSRDKVAKITQQLFGEIGSYLYGGDAAIIVRGEIKSLVTPHGPTVRMTHGHAKLISGLELEVASVHLSPPPGRFDFWSPAAWKSYAGERRSKRSDIAEIGRRLNAVPPGTTILIGGDFNMPSNDAAWDDMPSYLHDTFDEAGVGWGNTITSTMPVARFDQIWISNNLQTITVKAILSKNTDHRMVVCDIATPTVPSSQ